MPCAVCSCPAFESPCSRSAGPPLINRIYASGFTARVGSRDLDRGEAAVTCIGADTHATQLEVTDQTSIAAAAGRIGRERGRIDVLVNNAGMSYLGKAGRVVRGTREVEPYPRGVSRRGARGAQNERIRLYRCDASEAAIAA
ncbi:MAG: SDR family NAD(P)-dependent oxidoreductase [Gemmataceae bacterium]